MGFTMQYRIFHGARTSMEPVIVKVKYSSMGQTT